MEKSLSGVNPENANEGSSLPATKAGSKTDVSKEEAVFDVSEISNADRPKEKPDSAEKASSKSNAANLRKSVSMSTNALDAQTSKSNMNLNQSEAKKSKNNSNQNIAHQESNTSLNESSKGSQELVPKPPASGRPDSRNKLRKKSSGMSMEKLASKAALPDVAENTVKIDTEALVAHFKKLITLRKFNESLWKEEHAKIVLSFLESAESKKIAVFVQETSEESVLCIQNTLPVFKIDELQYFIKEISQGNDPISVANFKKRVQYGTVSGNSLESLLRLMNGVYVPLFLENRGWPESLRKEFSGQIHKFMAYLTDTTYQIKGHTVLYVPNENLSNVEAASKDKDVVQRLESLLVHWTRQIKEVVNNQHNTESAETLGPLEEIQFWKSRCIDLSGISSQLTRPEVEKILEVLRLSKSSYLEQFLRLSNLIQDGSLQAQDNLKFLSSLIEPCKELAAAEPKSIPRYLQTILNCIRIIWSNSKYYNTKERLTSLLRKVSNEIINRCSVKISLEQIFKGDVHLSVVSLNESIQCGDAWKSTYKKTANHVAKYSGQVWNFDQSSIFAQIDAFVQRCKDLLEICEGQMQFARKTAGGEKGQIPIFGGTKGPEIGKSLEDIEKAFEKQLNVLWENRKYILDVKATKWHDDYNLFKQGIKDLEVMMQNVIHSAFESTTSIESSVELLSIFYQLAKRETIKRAVEKKANEVLRLLISEINISKTEFETRKKSPELQRYHPDFSGSALWARSLLNRTSSSMSIVKAANYQLPIVEEAKALYEGLAASVDEYSTKCHSEWVASIPRNIMEKLDAPLMERKNLQLLEIKFDKDLVRLFTEIHYWQKLKFDIPFSVQEIYNKKEELRILRDSVLLVVRDYNNILEILTAEEINLLKERIRFLDRKINPGLTNLTWSSKGITEHFVKDCRKHSHDVQKIVAEFMDASSKIQNSCSIIANLNLWSVENKKVYDLEEFEGMAKDHRRSIEEKLIKEYEVIKSIVQQSYEVFKGDGKEVYEHWIKYVAKVDSWIENSITAMARKSLLEISNALNGEGGSQEAAGEIQPLYKVEVILKAQKVEFLPSLARLEETVVSISKDIVSIFKVIPRLTEKLSDAPNSLPSAFEVVAADEDVIKLLNNINSGLAKNTQKAQNYLRVWDSYREIWEINKDAFIRRYAKLKPAMSTFEADINRYTEVANNTQKEETMTNVNFVKLDCSPLKHALVAHCNQWQNKLTTLLNNNAAADLGNLHKMFMTNTEKLRRAPADLVQLSESMNLLAQLRVDSASIEAQFAPIHEQYQILEKYDVNIKDEEKTQLETLHSTWAVFQQTMNESEKTLHEYKSKFKSELLSSVEEFSKNVALTKDEFINNGPFSGACPIDQAFKLLDEYRSKLQSLASQERTLQQGLSVFKIEQAPSKDIEYMANMIENLTQIWQLTSDYTKAWNTWKVQQFKDLNVDSMDEITTGFQKRNQKLGKDIKDWDVWANMRDKIAQMKKILPLLKDMKNPAFRERHWIKINEITGKQVSPNDEDFNLERIADYSLEQWAEAINGISDSATKELLIESGINGIKQSWQEVSLDIVSFKADKGYYKLRSTDAIAELLEDNQVTLSGMKLSKFFKPFEKEVDHWERVLSHIMEIIELLLLVQRQWMYLENIFIGAEDIRKQLPKESSVFDDINRSWKAIMEKMMEDKNVLRATHEKKLLETLRQMNTQLEKIQKSLDMYLETKRQIFPRFYFLSNDDLLEILGQTKDPNSVQPHLKKCFDNIHRLEFNQTGLASKKHFEAVGMHSGDGEYVPFHESTFVEGPVENWLTDVENLMKDTLKKQLLGALNAFKKVKRDKWLKDWPGQLLITSGQIQWTLDCTKALLDVEKGEKGALKELKRKQISNMKKLGELVKMPLSKVERKKLVALITIEVHSRDIIDKMAKNNCSEVTSFDWLSQLRFYWDKDLDDCLIKQTNSTFQYGYEYLGNSGRLVITPLTDRCFMTLTTALRLHRGGSPQGKAGSGKTESVKDLGKAMGQFVLVVNCSDALDYKSMGRMFAGLAQTGSWSCFDEFNRIDIEVLSVVGLQISTILAAVARKAKTFVFENKEIKLKHSCAIFITMNPSYAGRTELPDNVKSLFRPVAMMIPDSAYIAEIVLFAEGFSNTKVLSKKVESLYRLSAQQLSKQAHYDFGLRGLTSSLRTAGNRKRIDDVTADEIILFLALKDMNVPKLTAEDTPLFIGILYDLFPGIEAFPAENAALKKSILEEMQSLNLQADEKMSSKVLQLNETKAIRHGVMVIGKTSSGKSTVIKVLQGALNRLSKTNTEFNSVKTFVINPKSMPLGSLYGSLNTTTNEWTDGVLSTIMRTICLDEKKDLKWLVLDGPVDTLWIESMNTLLDDNKILTLPNGDRIALPEQVSLVFEVDNLESASPATVSRCGMIYLDHEDLGWRPFIMTWMQTKFPEKLYQDTLLRLIDKYLPQLVDFKKKNCLEIVPVDELSAIRSFCNIFSACSTVENGVDIQDVDSFPKMIEMWFLFSIIWSLGGSLTDDSRRTFDMFLREIEGQFPSKDTVYEYFIDIEKKKWSSWEEKIPSGWKYNPALPFHKILVPTIDTERNEFLIKTLRKNRIPVLLVGDVGTGKTSIIQSTLSNPDDGGASMVISMSAQTTAERLQTILENRMEKRTKNIYVPIGGKSLTVFVDDLNMPRKDDYGSQPPLELLKHWMDTGFVYDVQKKGLKYLTELTLLAAMGKPGGGRNSLHPRFQSRFNIIHAISPNEASLFRIFSMIINQKLSDFEEDVKPLGDIMTRITVDIYFSISQHLLPTPTKMHYVFNLRDISKVFQGLLRANREFYDAKDTMIKLWLHETYRVFYDRMGDTADKEYFYKLVDDKMVNYFQMGVKQLVGDRKVPLFGDFLVADESRIVYQEYDDIAKLRSFLQEKLVEHNQSPGAIQLDLVIFRDVIEHIVRLCRILTLPFGHGLLIGLGGSGRRSLSKLAGYVTNSERYMIEITKHYKLEDFREDLKRMFILAGAEKKRVVFIVSDTQIIHNSFLEDISNILSIGEVPNLFTVEEFADIHATLSPELQSLKIPDNAESAFQFFLNRARNNLHILFGMSPVGDSFRNRLRMFPSLTNNTTIIWFSEWPEDALLEVALKYTEDIDLGNETIRKAVAQSFVTVHTSASTQSQLMLQELRRTNYVTPTNYLELVKGYRRLLQDKGKAITKEAKKLQGGLSKLDDTRVAVEKISVELDQSKKQVSQYQKQCEDYLVIIVQQKREADDQAKVIAARSEKLSVEEEEVRGVANAAQADLDQALPALNAATKALEALNKKDLHEVKSYGKPPALVEKVMEAVMVLKKCEPTWEEAKRQLGNPNFIKQLVGFDKDNISDKILKKISQYCADENFNPEIIGRVSTASKSLCLWVKAMEAYGNIFRQVAPKREKLRLANEALEKKQATLKEAKDKLAEIQAKIDELKNQYEEKVALKEKLRKESEETEAKLRRAEQLVSGLSGEKGRWEKSIKKYEESIKCLPGDCLIGAAFLSYTGPFNSFYRNRLVNQTWIPLVKSLEIPFSAEFSFNEFLGKSTEIRDWNLQGLPSDLFSSENGIIATRGLRFPLLIDPQGQANKWIKNMEAAKNLKVIDAKETEFLRILEHSIQTGQPVLMENVLEKIDSSLDPLLNKSIIKKGPNVYIRLADKEIDYNPEFRFYMTTKLTNPKYSPEVAAKTAIINFSVKEKGLEDQLLGIVVRKEKPELEEQKDTLLLNVAGAKKKLIELEDEILNLLANSQGSILEDEKLVNALQSSKTTSEDVIRQLKVSEQTEVKIDAAREGYRPCAQRASVLFFVLNDLGNVDPMYQFSLDSYILLFEKSISKSKKTEDLNERIQNLNDFHLQSVYKNTCRGLFGRHKLLFAFQMTAKLLEAAGKLNKEEYDFFLRGGLVLDRDSQLPNPCGDWISENIWDNVTELSKIAGFTTLISSLEQNEREWKFWFMNSEPEELPLPGEWDSKLTDLQRILIIRSLRPDRVILCAQKYIVNNLGPKYIESPVLDIEEIYADSSNKTPIIFIISPGVDPTQTILSLANKKGMTDRLDMLSLGQGQAPKATRYIKEGMRAGNWVYLANCHLSISWLPALEKIIDMMATQTFHPDFRLWLSSAPHQSFSISILQSSIKLVTEPPKGLKANMIRLYNQNIDLNKCTKPKLYKRLLFALCFYHATLLERSKFMNLGWNVPYAFNDSDFEVCENLLCNLLDEYKAIPWDALKYLIAEANYGGRVTDEWDRRILKTYINQYFNEDAINTNNYRLSSMPTYYIPDDGDLNSYHEFLNMWPSSDKPEAFGQHTNADIASQIRESNSLLTTLLSLQPQLTTSSGLSREEKVQNVISEIEKQLPEFIDYEICYKFVKSDLSPINIVLLQEINRYNALLECIKESLTELAKGIKGLIVMTSELEEIFQAIGDGRIPTAWGKAYPSVKPLGVWTRDLIQRIDFFNEWAKGNEPKSFWLSAFTFPTGFLTAVLQKSARKNNVPIDILSWEFNVLQADDEGNIQAGPKEGVYIHGIYLEGASWDRKQNCLKEPKAMELVTQMPTIHFKPTESKKKSSKGIYYCPVYYFPVRTGSEERPSFIIAVDLKADSDYYVKRGTAMLLSLG